MGHQPKKTKESKKTFIGIGQKARQRIRELFPPVQSFNRYVQGLKDALNIPDDWVINRDGSGFEASKGDVDGK